MGVFNLSRRMRPKSARRQRLIFESLEDRTVFDGTYSLAASPVADAEGESDSPAPAEEGSLIRFESASSLQNHLLAQGVAQWKHLFGKATEDWLTYDMVLFRDDALESISYSTGSTNVQVNGIDEGDLVKTDGEYLYLARHNQITIVDIRDPADCS